MFSPDAVNIDGTAPPAAIASDRRGRLIMAVAVGLITAFFVMELATRPGVHTDFEYLWRATRLWSAGVDPYAVEPRSSWLRVWPLPDPLFYPLPALMLVWPLHWLPQSVATSVFVALPAALLAWRLAKNALWPLLALASPSFVMAVVLGQWTPWLLLAMLWPAIGFLFASKPTIGVACFAYRPTPVTAFGGFAILLVSLVIWPSWPIEWIDNLKAVVGHPSPIVAPFGWLLSLAVLRWRRREARLLLAMACIPQLLLFADQLPLMLVARSGREAALLTIGGWIAALLWYVRDAEKLGAVSFAAPYVMVGVYLPALWIVLRQSNVGRAPSWLERRLASFPAWLRGEAVA
jgi:hypothetical protein